MLIDPSFSFEGNAEVGSHFVSIEINGSCCSIFSASAMHSAWLAFGKFNWKVCESSPNPNVTIIIRIKLLVMQTSVAQLKMLVSKIRFSALNQQLE